VSGRFISFEGPEGAGKSTQIVLLARALTDFGVDVVTTREPGGTRLGEQIRGLLLELGQQSVTGTTEALLHSAARAQHVEEVIRPALLAGKTVLCDRFVESTLAYQGGGRGLPLEELRSIQQFATGGIEPDVRILLDLPVDVGLQRRQRNAEVWNRMDDESLGFHERVRAMYHRLVADRPEAWLVVDATADVGQIAQAIEAGIASRLRQDYRLLASGARS
jgi:dTMP kinase